MMSLATQVWIDVYDHVRGLTRCFAVFENASGKSSWKDTNLYTRCLEE